jgi:ubiquinone biosynthesis protein
MGPSEGCSSKKRSFLESLLVIPGPSAAAAVVSCDKPVSCQQARITSRPQLFSMVNILSLPDAIRDVRRAVEIVAVLSRHGFGDALQDSKIDRIFEKGKALVGLAPTHTEGHLSRAARLRKVMEELGPTFVKLGQLLSTRPDLIPADWAQEFKGLQHDCPAVPFEAIKERLQVEFPGKLDQLFRSIDPVPLAAASIAQVHRAVLHDGSAIVLKVVRPGIHEIVSADLAILRALAEASELHFSNLGYSPVEVVKEFDREIHRELDLIHEGQSTDRLRALFVTDNGVVFPKVYWEATTTSVLGLEEIRGTLLSELKITQLSVEERRALVTNGARAVFRQCLEEGFFHADPHPGNLVALSEGRIAFIDCGMTGQLDGDTLTHLGELAQGVVSGDVERVARVVAALADAPPDKEEDRAFRADIREFVAHFAHAPLGRLHMGDLLQDFFNKVRAHSMRCPADLVLLIKALTTIEFVAKDLDPTFDVIAFSEPYVLDLVKRRHSISEIQHRAGEAFIEYATFAENFPRDLGVFLKQLRKNKVAITIEHAGLFKLTETVEHASKNISFALVASALLVSSAILVLADRGQAGNGPSAIGMTGFIGACLLIVFRVFGNRRLRK